MDCLFCKIVQKEIPSETVYEDEKTMAFLDIHPRSLAHTVVISRHHSPTILELPAAEIGPLFEAVKKVIALIETKFSPQGFTIGINHGKISGQTIDHLHVHIIPRFEGDGGGSIHSVVDNPPAESIQWVGEKLRS